MQNYSLIKKLYYSCSLSTATIEYSCLSVCLSVHTMTQIVVYENTSSDIGHQGQGHRVTEQGSKCWVPRFPQALNIFHGNSTLHLKFPAGNPAKNAGNSSYAWGIKV